MLLPITYSIHLVTCNWLTWVSRRSLSFIGRGQLTHLVFHCNGNLRKFTSAQFIIPSCHQKSSGQEKKLPGSCATNDLPTVPWQVGFLLPPDDSKPARLQASPRAALHTFVCSPEWLRSVAWGMIVYFSVNAGAGSGILIVLCSLRSVVYPMDATSNSSKRSGPTSDSALHTSLKKHVWQVNGEVPAWSTW